MIFEGYSLESRWWWWRRVIASAFVVTGLHAGLVAYAYLMPAPEEVTEEAQGAFMLELAPLPVAAAADAAAAPGPSAEVTQPQIDEKTPTEEVPEVKPPEEVPLPVAPDPELAMPIQKPVEEPKEEKEEEEKPIEKVEVKEEKKEEEPEVQEAKPQEAMVQAGGPPTPASTPAPQTAARRQGTTDRPSDEAMTWSKALMNHLSRHRRYPAEARRAGHQGAVQVRFKIDRKGKVLSAQVIKASRSSSLDAEAVAMLKRASPLPQPPDDFGGETVELVIPIEFTIK
ncbi:MAG TPA: energy transducer TonB [Hyphomicrobiaceae bacterium]|nr:energy transducer TonB [Hyphomicrobiaceae bacterium]